MSVVKKSEHKTIVIGWDTKVVQGKTVSVQVKQHDNQLHEKRTVDNDGETNIFFPAGYHGECNVVVKGSKSGEEAGTLQV